MLLPLLQSQVQDLRVSVTKIAMISRTTKTCITLGKVEVPFCTGLEANHSVKACEPYNVSCEIPKRISIV